MSRIKSRESKHEAYGGRIEMPISGVDAGSVPKSDKPNDEITDPKTNSF
jgi:hypothetical protein